ncbi:MAG: hypothetical protein RR614_13830 [Eubacterium sp.]
MDTKSEYYMSFEENMQRFDIDPEAYEFTKVSIQSVEEMMFKFAMFILN